MRAWGRGAVPINKMDCPLPGFTQICGVHGTVSWTGESNGSGEVQLWSQEARKEYYIYASKTAERAESVSELLMFYSFTSCPDKIKTLLTKKSKFHFVQYLKQMVPCESTIVMNGLLYFAKQNQNQTKPNQNETNRTSRTLRNETQPKPKGNDAEPNQKRNGCPKHSFFRPKHRKTILVT